MQANKFLAVEHLKIKRILLHFYMFAELLWWNSKEKKAQN